MYIVKSKWIITSSEEVLKNGAILVDGKKIKKILHGESELKEYSNLEVIDYKDNIVIPSFTNAHIHQYGILSWGIPKLSNFDDFEGFLKVFWWPLIEDRLTTKEIVLTTEVSCLDMLSSGITSFCDSIEAPLIEDGFLNKQAEIVSKYGLKGILSLESSERINSENGYSCLKQNSEFIDKANNYDDIKGCICTHTTFTCSDKFIKDAKKVANENGSFLQFHMSESIYEKNYTMKQFGVTPTEYLKSLNVLDEKTLISQCVKVDSKEIDILSESGCKIVHNPISNCEVGGGIAPIQEMLDKGIDVALGTDGYVNDFFEVMRFAFLIHKANLENTEVMDAKTVFKMATENGAKALGYNQGKLEEGYSADFIVLEDKFSTPINKNNIFDLLVVKGEKDMINEVYVSGNKYEKFKIDDEKNKLRGALKELAGEFWKGIK